MTPHFKRFHVKVKSPQGDTLLDSIIVTTSEQTAILRGYDDVREVLAATAELIVEEPQETERIRNEG